MVPQFKRKEFFIELSSKLGRAAALAAAAAAAQILLPDIGSFSFKKDGGSCKEMVDHASFDPIVHYLVAGEGLIENQISSAAHVKLFVRSIRACLTQIFFLLHLKVY